MDSKTARDFNKRTVSNIILQLGAIDSVNFIITFELLLSRFFLKASF